MTDSMSHREISEELLRRLGAARDMSPLVLAECACAHATLALADTIRAATTQRPPTPPPDTTWLQMET